MRVALLDKTNQFYPYINYWHVDGMVPGAGFELATYGLQISCSTTELTRQQYAFVTKQILGYWSI